MKPKRFQGFTRHFHAESTAKAIFFASAACSTVAVAAILAYILIASIPAFREIGFFRFVFGTQWAPDFEGVPVSERFGILPMIVGSLYATLGALLVGGGIGIGIAIYLAYFCPKRFERPLTRLIQLLAGIPSVVYGYFGAEVIVPALAKISPNGNGNGLLAVTILLSIMILPTVASLARDGMCAVPHTYAEASYGLGMTHEQTVFRVMVPSARSGIFAALGLGVGRAVGETMAVIMIAGNTVQFPKGLFDGFRTLTGNIVLEMAYATGTHRDALIATGLVLLLFVLALNLVLYLVRKPRIKKGSRRAMKLPVSDKKTQVSYVSRTLPARVGKYVCTGLVVTLVVTIAGMLIYLFVRGVPHVTWSFLFGSSDPTEPTIAPAFVSTGILIVIALAIAFPIGIAAAIYLVEYARSGSFAVKVIRLFTDTLAGIPSIVFGLFGAIVFKEAFKLGYSLWSGGLTLSIMILPTMIRSVEESLIQVPTSLREASYALGAGKLRTVWKIVLPCAVRGILTAVILSVGRIVSESAALVLTAGTVDRVPVSPSDPGSSFAVMMYMFASEGLYMDQAYATAVVLIVLVFALNAMLAWIGRDRTVSHGKSLFGRLRRKPRESVQQQTIGE